MPVGLWTDPCGSPGAKEAQKTEKTKPSATGVGGCEPVTVKKSNESFYADMAHRVLGNTGTAMVGTAFPNTVEDDPEVST